MMQPKGKKRTKFQMNNWLCLQIDHTRLGVSSALVRRDVVSSGVQCRWPESERVTTAHSEIPQRFIRIDTNRAS
jgi:hypothetical protein